MKIMRWRIYPLFFLHCPYLTKMNKEVCMNKTGLVTIIVFLASVVFCIPSSAVTIDQIDGTWDTYSEAKLKISKLGSFTDQNPSVTQLNLSGTFVLDETTSTGPYSYTGTFTIINEKKLSFELDTNGINELIRTWEDWAAEIAGEEGVTISGISFNIVSLTVSQPSINKKTLIPKKATVKAKGIASAWVNGVFYERKFSYTSKVSFIGPG